MILLLHFPKLFNLVPICIQLDVRSSQNGASRSPSEGKLNQTMAIMPMPSSGPVGPTTNLNIGMDLWTNTASSTPAIHGKVTPTAVTGAVVPAEQWIQVCVLLFTLHLLLLFSNWDEPHFHFLYGNIQLCYGRTFSFYCVISVYIFCMHHIISYNGCSFEHIYVR